MPVHIIPGDYPRAFVMCDKRDDIGRVFVTMDELQQWRMTDAAIGRTLLAACDNIGVTEITLRHRIATLPLHGIVSITDGEVTVDSRRLSQELAPQPSGEQPNRFARTGDHWTITYQNKTRTYKDTMGIRYLAELIRKPETEISALDLYYAVNPPPKATGDLQTVLSDDVEDSATGFRITDLDSEGDELRPGEMTEIKIRARQIQDEIDDASLLGDITRQETLEEEQEKVLVYLSQNLGLGGKPRKASSPFENVRKNISKQIWKRIRAFKPDIPALAEHLEASVTTGALCKYAPDPPVRWSFDPS